MDDIIVHLVSQCVEKGILEGSGLSIDTTHTEANTFKCIVGRVMKCLANNMFKTIAKEKENGEVPEEIHQEISDHKEIENHKEAKATMKSYLEETFHLGSLIRSFSTKYDNYHNILQRNHIFNIPTLY